MRVPLRTEAVLRQYYQFLRSKYIPAQTTQTLRQLRRQLRRHIYVYSVYILSKLSKNNYFFVVSRDIYAHCGCFSPNFALVASKFFFLFDFFSKRVVVVVIGETRRDFVVVLGFEEHDSRFEAVPCCGFEERRKKSEKFRRYERHRRGRGHEGKTENDLLERLPNACVRVRARELVFSTERRTNDGFIFDRCSRPTEKRDFIFTRR